MDMDNVKDTTDVTVDTTATITTGAAATIAATAHGFSVGDVVTYTAAGTALAGLASGTSYIVGTVADANSFTLLTTTSGAVTYGNSGSANGVTGAGGNASDKFTRIGRSLDGDSTSGDSIAVVGVVRLSSQNAYTVSPGNTANIFSSGTSELTASHNTISGITLTTKAGATKAMSIIDGALLMISGIRSDMGSANNRLESTIDNLSNIAVNAQKSLSTVEDANFAEETARLTKAQILAKAATSMLAQANQAKETMLALLK